MPCSQWLKNLLTGASRTVSFLEGGSIVSRPVTPCLVIRMV